MNTMMNINCAYPLVVYLDYFLLKIYRSFFFVPNQKPNKYGFSKQLWNRYALEIFHLLKDFNVRKQNNYFHQLFFDIFSTVINSQYFSLKKRFTTIELLLLFQQKNNYYKNTVLHYMNMHNFINLNSLIHEDLFSLSNLSQKNEAGFNACQKVLISRNAYKYKKQSLNLFLKFNYQITKEDITVAKKTCNYEIILLLIHKFKQQILEECWLLWTLKYDSFIQWLPRELKDEQISLIKKKKQLKREILTIYSMCSESMTTNSYYK